MRKGDKEERRVSEGEKHCNEEREEAVERGRGGEEEEKWRIREEERGVGRKTK